MTSQEPARLLKTLAVAWLAILLFFWLFPSVDRAFSDTFFFAWPCAADAVEKVCGGFVLERFWLLRLLRGILFYLPPALAILLALSLFVPRLDRFFTSPEGSRHNRLVLLGVWIADAGIFVNMLLKAFSGRPRPADTTLFGGHLGFVPAGDFSGACTSNCSFISGEAASAGWLLCLIALLSADKRRKAFPIVFTISAATAIMRVVFGRHFFSDALLGWLSAFVFFALFAVVFGWDGARRGRQ